MSAILVAKIFLLVINAIHKPKQGVFLRDPNDKDYCYWSLRSVVKKWPAWLARQLNIPIFEILLFKLLGIKIHKSSAVQEGWVDVEFVDVGKNVRLGQGSLIMSSIFIKDKLIIQKVTIKDNVVIGAHSVVTPGTTISENTTLDSLSMTQMNQTLEPNAIYSGTPAQKILRNDPIREKTKLEKRIFQAVVKQKEIDEEELEGHDTGLSVPFHVYVFSGWTIIGGSFVVPGFLFIMYAFLFLIPDFLTTSIALTRFLDPYTYFILLTIPLVFILLYLIHLFFVALFTRLFYRYADSRGPAQGVFDRNLDEHSRTLDYYHWRSFLLKYPVFAFIRSPFPWLLGWELRFIGSNEVGKGTIFEECYIHSHINPGEDCYLGTFSHLTNHLVDGVYGEENLTFYGAEIGDDCVFNALIGGLPGLEVGDKATLLPMSSTIKFDKLGDGGVYSGFPARRLKPKQVKKFTGGLLDDEQTE
ncbi:MAG: hypothetical protein ACOC44_15865 [Promethearchaeia archaeon]